MKPIWTVSMGDYIYKQTALCELYSRFIVLIFMGSYIPILFAYTKTSFYAQILNYSQTNRKQHQLLRVLMFFGLFMIIAAVLLTNGESSEVQGVQLCFDFSKNQTVVIIGVVYTMWTGITYYCIYYIFTRSDDGMSASLIESIPILKIHLWINATLVPIMFISTCVVMIFAMILVLCIFLSDRNPHSADWRIVLEYVMFNATLADHLINSVIMGYTIYGYSPSNETQASQNSPAAPVMMMVSDPLRSISNVVPNRSHVVGFPGIPPVRITDEILANHTYLRGYIIELGRYAPHNLFHAVDHATLVDYVIHGRSDGIVLDPHRNRGNSMEMFME